MQLRCKACNSKLSAFDWCSKKSAEIPEEEDLCSVCLDIIRLADTDELDLKSYQHEHLTENWVNFSEDKENS